MKIFFINYIFIKFQCLFTHLYMREINLHSFSFLCTYFLNTLSLLLFLHLTNFCIYFLHFLSKHHYLSYNTQQPFLYRQHYHTFLLILPYFFSIEPIMTHIFTENKRKIFFFNKAATNHFRLIHNPNATKLV